MSFLPPRSSHLPQTLRPPPAVQKVLVVDDVPGNASVIRSVLHDLGDVLIANHGMQALELAREHQPDLILLDVKMPEMDGFEVCRRLKADLATAQIPVIFLTAQIELHCEELGLNLGAVDFVTTPFRAPVLRARVRNHLELMRQRQVLERLSHSDPLTDLANRRFLDAQLGREYLRLQRLEQPLSLIMIDVDFFKAYNDHYGHLAGDDCLVRLARAFSEVLQRPGDLLARYGGEEFLCLLPHTDLEGAVQVAQGLLRTVRDLGLPHESSPHGGILSVSLGVASATPSPSSNAQQLVALADHRLYQAKRQGRDQVVFE
ncbi:GGDEF domain-containing protein [Comamonas composti]|uniref:GGDEF domain-containing protein n=1 Tax=Comamonas composti TaxID=408558 RepID=UPI000554D714|nr:diguanylate cyclase [Comamonas composti]